MKSVYCCIILDLTKRTNRGSMVFYLTERALLQGLHKDLFCHLYYLFFTQICISWASWDQLATRHTPVYYTGMLDITVTHQPIDWTI